MNAFGLFLFLIGTLIHSLERIVEVPIDHANSQSRKIKISFTLEIPFDEKKETVFLFKDPVDEVYGGFQVSPIISENYNLVTIKGRYESKDLMEFLQSFHSNDWEVAYKYLNQWQVARDIEFIRRELLGDKQVSLIGFSSSAALFHYYQAHFPARIKIFISLSPLLLDIQENLSFWKQIGFIDSERLTLENSQLTDLAFYAHQDFFTTRSTEIDSLLPLALEESSLKPGIRNAENLSVSLQVRLFELSQNTSPKDKVIMGFRLNSSPIWETFESNSFEVFGQRYDENSKFLGKLLLVGGAFNLLQNPKSFDALAEFYPNSTLVILKDGQSLTKFFNSPVFPSILTAFLEDNTSKKIGTYAELRSRDLLFSEKEYNSIKVGR